jgi:oligoribonuclease NrnB/cAMP/cGMP phosphodiesterase (DHH superfamily)
VKKLKKNPSEFLEKEVQFLLKIKPNDRVVLIFDADVDGVSSAAIALSGLRKLKIKNIRTVHRSWDAANNLSGLVKKFDKGIILDVPTPVIEKQLKKIKKSLLVIDHHPSRDVSSKNVVYMNPRLNKKEIYQPASYLTYKVFSKVVDLEDKEWLAVVGTVGDYGFEDCKDLLKKYLKIEKKEDIWKTKLGKTAMMINGSIAVFGSKKILNILTRAKSLDEFKNDKKANFALRKFEEELGRAKLEFKKNLEIYVDFDLIFSKIKPKLSRIGSTLSTYIATKYPNKLIMILEKLDGNCKIHGRMENGRINVGELLKKLCGGGGHREAGAGMIKEKESNGFKANLIKEIGRFSK